MNLGEIAMLRTKLRALNIEYSALVRSKPGEGSFVKMGKLRAERRGMMTLIGLRADGDADALPAVEMKAHP